MSLTEEQVLQSITDKGGAQARFSYFVATCLSVKRTDSVALRTALGKQKKYMELRDFVKIDTTYEDFEAKALELVGWS
jgi:hypothetical protein